MPPQPVLVTERLRLRPFTEADAPAVERLAGEREVAVGTLNLPHPYEPGTAVAWIRETAAEQAAGTRVVFAIERLTESGPIGAIGLHLRPEHRRAELGYWLGRPFWGRGYTTEAAARVVRHGFEQLDLQRIHACHFGGNPASGRVMEKIGMRREGVQRRHLFRWGDFHDAVQYGILKAEWMPPQEQ